MAHAAGIQVKNPQDAVPQLFLKMFPAWFAGFTFAAIAIGALVPAAVMSIGAANTFTRNVWKPFVNADMTPQEEAVLAKLMSLVVKIGALAVIIFVPTQFALDLQLLGGIWMIQIFPAIVFGLFTRWFNSWALLAGWAVGTILGTYLSWGPTSWLPVHGVFDWGFSAYNGLISVILNIAIAVVLSFVLRGEIGGEVSKADFADLPARP
jgi:solute:Na+ symporter, SSS family